MKMKTQSLIGAAAIGGLSTLACSLTPIDRAQAATISTLYNTGVNDSGAVLANGSADSHYNLTVNPGAGGTTTIARTGSAFPLDVWATSSGQATWLGPNTDTAFNSAPGNYTYRTTFDLSGFLANTAQINGKWSADNTGLDILLNGQSLGLTVPGFSGFSSFNIASGFQAGVNTLDFVVNNGGSVNNPTGLLVEMSGSADLASSTSVPEPADMLGTVVAFGSVVLLKRKFSKQK